MLAQRITYVGELGYELYTARRDAVQVWDALMSAASPEPVGYAALDSLRIEKGYRYFGADLTSSDTPFEAGLGFCVAPDKRRELERAPAQRLRTLVVGDERLPDDLRRGGGAGERRRGDRARPQRRLRLHRQANIALAKLPSGLAEGAEVQVDVFGELVPARLAPDALYDPGHERVRS